MENQLIGIAGPSGAGKSTVSKLVRERLGDCAVLKLDDYFHDVGGFPEVNGKPNWDIPECLNFDLLCGNLQELRRGNPTEVPCFDKTTLERTFRTAVPRRFMLVEGFLLFHDQLVRELFDLKIYLDVSEEESISRRTTRDPARGEYIKEVVVPNYRIYGEPTKALADVVVDGAQPPDAVARQILRIIAARPAF